MLDLTHPYHPQTVAIRHGHERTHQQEHSEAIFATSSFVFESAAQAAARFGGEEDGNIYSRFTNPTVAGFENRLAAMEGAKHCVAQASGMAAISTMIMTVLNAGDHIVSSSSIFGTTVSVFTKVFSRFGIETTFVDLDDPAQWKAAIKDNTKLFFLESPSNPLGQIGDIEALGKLAREEGILFAIDNAFCTPVLQQPLSLGADIVIHTATKYLDGQGRCVGGAIVTNDDKIHEDLIVMMRTCGPSLSPFNAWTFSKGLETLPLRMMQHSKNAMALASWLVNQPAVKTVNYPGLSTHPQHELAKKQRNPIIANNDPNGEDGFGGVLSFEVHGGTEEAWKVIDSVAFLSITANLGDAKTTITHPATTTHGRLTQSQRNHAGISDSLIRVALGLEFIDDVIHDIDRGLSQLV